MSSTVGYAKYKHALGWNATAGIANTQIGTVSISWTLEKACMRLHTGVGVGALARSGFEVFQETVGHFFKIDFLK